MKKYFISMLAIFMVLWVGNVFSAEYPAKPITIIVPFAAGGGTDIGARIAIKAAEKHIEKPIVVQNIGGGGSEVGISQMVRSKPDGYTIAAFNSASVILTTMRKASYHPIKDVEPICLMVSDPRLFVVRADDKRFNTPKEYLQYARDNPEKLTIGTSGAGTSGHLALLLMNKAAGVKAKHVGFGGAGESKAAFLGGHIDSVTQTFGEVKGMLKDGKVKIIAVATEERMKELPDVPTFKEVGINLIISSNRGIAAPKGTPKEIIEKLADVFKKASVDPEYIQQMEKMGLPAQFLGPAEFSKLIKDEYELYSEVVKELNLEKK